MEDSVPDIILLFICLKCDQNRPLSQLLPSPVVLTGLKPHKVLQGLAPPSFTGSNLTALLIFGYLIENLLLSVEVKTDRYHFKNQILGNERSRKRLIT